MIQKELVPGYMDFDFGLVKNACTTVCKQRTSSTFNASMQVCWERNAHMFNSAGDSDNTCRLAIQVKRAGYACH
jgi:hypothetical protein